MQSIVNFAIADFLDQPVHGINWRQWREHNITAQLCLNS